MLEMYASNDSEMPVEVFAGHTDVVKEFVWRKGGPGELYTIPLSVTNLFINILQTSSNLSLGRKTELYASGQLATKLSKYASIDCYTLNVC